MGTTIHFRLASPLATAPPPPGVPVPSYILPISFQSAQALTISVRCSLSPVLRVTHRLLPSPYTFLTLFSFPMTYSRSVACLDPLLLCSFSCFVYLDSSQNTSFPLHTGFPAKDAFRIRFRVCVVCSAVVSIQTRGSFPHGLPENAFVFLLCFFVLSIRGRGTKFDVEVQTLAKRASFGKRFQGTF